MHPPADVVSRRSGCITLRRVSATGAGPHELHGVPVEGPVPDGFQLPSAHGAEAALVHIVRTGIAYLEVEESVGYADGPDALLTDAVLLVHAQEFCGDEPVQFRLGTDVGVADEDVLYRFDNLLLLRYPVGHARSVCRLPYICWRSV